MSIVQSTRSKTYFKKRKIQRVKRSFWFFYSVYKRKLLLYKFLKRRVFYNFAIKNLNTSWLFIKQVLKSLLINFNVSNKTLIISVFNFSKYLYKIIRKLQKFLNLLKWKIKDTYRWKLLSPLVSDDFYDISNCMNFFINKNNSLTGTFLGFDENLKRSFSKNSDFEIYLYLKTNLGIHLNYAPCDIKTFNVHLFIFYLKLISIEKLLQTLNWRLFRIGLDLQPYNFRIPHHFKTFTEDVIKFGYDSWKNKQFNYVVNKKLRKKWRFWREFRRLLMFDKTHLIIKFKWLHNHKRILRYQFFELYNLKIERIFKKFYKHRMSKSLLFNFMFNLEYRIDILSMRLFKIRTIRLVQLFLFFGYLTVNNQLVNRYYILQIGDIVFGWFLRKNYKFWQFSRKRFYNQHRTKKSYSFLEFEPIIFSFICLSVPLRFSWDFRNKDQFIAKKFTKYMYLQTY